MRTSFCSLLQLLPPCLCSLSFRSSLIWWLCGREGHAYLSCIMPESPPSTAGLVISSFTGVKLVLWGVFDTCGICSDAPWILVQQKLAWESSSRGLSTAFSVPVWHWLCSGVSSFREDFEVRQLSWVEWDVSTSSNAFPNRTVLLTCVCFGPSFAS